MIKIACLMKKSFMRFVGIRPKVRFALVENPCSTERTRDRAAFTGKCHQSLATRCYNRMLEQSTVSMGQGSLSRRYCLSFVPERVE